MSDSIVKLKTGYNPEIIDASGITLPLELKNSLGDNLAYIYKDDQTGKYRAFVNSHEITNYGFKFDDITECLTGVFGHLYQEMNNYRKQAEEYRELKNTLKKALK